MVARRNGRNQSAIMAQCMVSWRYWRYILLKFYRKKFNKEMNISMRMAKVCKIKI